MTLGICPTPKLRGSSLPLRRDRSVSSNATSALAGGSWRGVPRRSVLVQTAQRDDLESRESQRATHNNADTAAALADAHSISRASRAHSSPLSFNDRRHLPNLSCNSPGSTSCFSIHGIADPCLDDGLDLKIYQYMVDLVRSGTTEERAAEVIRQWSGGGGVEAVDLRKLRSHFMLTTLAEVVRKHATPAVLPVTLTCLSYWSLGLLPGTDEAVLPPAVRGALVAANLLLLVYFASGSLRSTGRMFRVGRAALDFSGQAELVLLAMRDLAEGHGVLIQAALPPSATAAATTATTTSARGSAGPGASTAAITAAAGAPVVPSAIAAAAAAAQRHASRRRVLEASAAAMRHVKRQAAAAAAATAAATVAADTPSSPAPVEGSLPSSSSSLPPASSHSSPSPSSSPTPWEQPRPRPQPPTPPPTPSPSVSTPLSSLDSYLVMWQAAELSGGFDAVAELGMAAEAAQAAAAMYARYGDSARGGRIGDYELRRLLQEAGCPDLSPEERQLVLLLHSRDTTAAGAGAGAGPGFGSGSPRGRGRGKGWLTFAEWAAWWAATPTPTPIAAAE